MANESPLGALSRLSAASLGVFSGASAVKAGVTRKQLLTLRAAGVIERVLPDTYRMTAVRRSTEQGLRAALLWGGAGAAAADRSAGEIYGLEGVRAGLAEIVVPGTGRPRRDRVVVHRARDRAALMLRRQRGLLVTRRWHDDANDYEDDNEKWSIPGRHGYRIVFATWAKVIGRPDLLVRELATSLAA